MFTKKYLVIGLILLAFIAIPTTVLLSQKSQEARSRAAASTTLFFAPETTEGTPLKKTVGETISLDVMVTPGTNLPSTIKLELLYDPTKFSSTAKPFSVNTTAFPTTFEAPVASEGRVRIAVSIGSDSTKAIQKTTKVGTLTLTAKEASTTATMISFGSISEVLSLGTQDQASENTLASTKPAYILIGGIPDPTTLSFTAFLHGIGDSGDNANPTASTLSNKKPLHESRPITVEVYNNQNILASSASGTIKYASAAGVFNGSIQFGNEVPKGIYTIKVKEPTHLKRLLNGIITIEANQVNQLAPFALIAGDVNDDNKLNALDYNLIIGCYSDIQPAVSCNDTTKVITDINDDGNTNQYDYNLFLREVTVQNGN